ncbi:hypothetical protein PTTG_26707 [Puccinia triticina 1-1 BBBD Race 1]|uniref:Magnesium transporter n=2 Tax=Puccinia triticina TaxID=208348 RepID=A0A180GR47_PUCT1|nr:uncharacterized protein PtA15_3A484 [Puccinia triticina]OAV95296.1 hypothetical protein PTTG_26707 [Puccinia triticina 1-1 BBBD Race 1]WAQ83117.1 hypothetical protein PtA15_3A484 [Puccinia triticina]WAR53959.1 hypothetical protein PtB15_3B468 [Puccinia triticina]
MLPWTLSMQNSRRSRVDGSLAPTNWVNAQLTPRDLPATKARTTSQIPIRFPDNPAGEGNTVLSDALKSQSTKRGKSDIYYTEISWQGITSPGLVASRVQFCRDKRIQTKDLRLLESNFGGPSISMRGDSIIINTNGFRALITIESVAMLNVPLVAYNESQNFPEIKSGHEGLAFPHRQEFTSNLLKGITSLRRGKRGLKIEEKAAYELEYSFKLLALRSILDIIFLSLEQDLEVLKASIRLLLSTLEKEIRAKTMEKLLVSTHQLKDFTGRCTNLQNCLDTIAEQTMQYLQTRQNQDLHKAILGETEEEQSLKVLHHSDLLTVIEQYSAEEIMEEVAIMMRHLQFKEDTANLIINSNQLDLVYVGLKLEVLAVGVTLGALLTGAFGMNLKSGIEESDWAFLIATGIIVTSCSAVIFIGWFYIRKIGRNM